MVIFSPTAKTYGRKKATSCPLIFLPTHICRNLPGPPGDTVTNRTHGKCLLRRDAFILIRTGVASVNSGNDFASRRDMFLRHLCHPNSLSVQYPFSSQLIVPSLFFVGHRTGPPEWSKHLPAGATYRAFPIIGQVIEVNAPGDLTPSVTPVRIVQAATVHRLTLIGFFRFRHC